MDKYIPERNLLHEFHRHEHHTGNPEKNDVITGNHRRCRIPLVQDRRPVRPAHGGKRPERRGKPCIKNVRILADMFASAFRAGLQIGTGRNDFTTIVAVPHRNTMSPPELAGNTPVMNIFQPLDIGRRKTFRNKFCFPRLHCFHSGTGKRFHFDKPLFRSKRFNNRMAARAVTDGMFFFFAFYKKPHIRKIFDDLFPALVAVHAIISARLFVHRAVFIHDDDGFQMVAFTHGKVIWIMGRCNLYTACTIFHIYIFISDDRNLSVSSRQLHPLPDQMRISFIFRINSDGRITGNRFRTGRRDAHSTFLISKRIIEIPQMAHIIFMLYFDIGKRRLAAGTPVGNAEPLINQTFFIKGYKYFTDSTGANIIHRKTFTAPITGRPQASDLLPDGIPVFFLPFPYAFQKFFTSQIVLCEAFFGNLFFHLDLRGDTGMVLSRKPEDIIPLHPFIADQDILQCIVQRMPHMKLPRYIGRRQHNAVRLFPLLRFIMKYTVFLPKVIPFLFNRTGFILP